MDLSFIEPTTINYYKNSDARELFFIDGLLIKGNTSSNSKMNHNSIFSPFSLPFIL